MFRTRTSKLVTVLALFALLALSIATPAHAFDGRGGDKMIITASETVNDDLYVAANEFTLDGTVNGDVIVVGSTITINGTVTGDLIAAGQTVVVNGTIEDDARIAGSVLYIGENASIGGDVVSAGYSLETRPGSAIGQDVVFAGGQVLLASDVTHNVQVASGGLDLRGSVGGNVKANIGEAGEQVGPPPTMFMPQSPIQPPAVMPGLTVNPAAKIGGNLEYTQSKDLTLPGGVVTGKITRHEPTVEESAAAKPPTPAEQALKWTLDLLRSVVTLILLALLLIWLFPKFLKALTEKLQGQPWPSLGWGVVAYAAFFFALLLLIVVMILGGVIFGFLTLGGLTGTIVWVGILTLFALIVAFVLATSFLTKIAVGLLGGKLILNAIKPELGEHRFWPLLLGVVIVAILVTLPFVGWLFNLLVVLFGLGALWLWGRERLAIGR